MEWDTFEHSYTEKTNDWYASVILIAGALIAVEFLFHNYLSIVLTFIATVAVILSAAQRPEMIHVDFRKNGIRAGNILYPYSTLDGFTIIEYSRTEERRLLLESTRRMMPLIVIPIAPEIDEEELHEFLAHYVPEKELYESLPHLLFERLGF